MKSNKLNWVVLFYPVFIIISAVESRCEETSIFVKEVNERKDIIKSAARIFSIDPCYLAAIIFTERELNYDWTDDAFDDVLAEFGLNSSLGFCQVKLKTAYFIELQIHDPKSVYYLGSEFESLISISRSPHELINKLNNDTINIFYAAAYIKIIMHRWEIDGYPIDKKPEIIGTLYQTGLFLFNGNERRPNQNPKSNKFGDIVKQSIKLFAHLNGAKPQKTSSITK